MDIIAYLRLHKELNKAKNVIIDRLRRSGGDFSKEMTSDALAEVLMAEKPSIEEIKLHYPVIRYKDRWKCKGKDTEELTFKDLI